MFNENLQLSLIGVDGLETVTIVCPGFEPAMVSKGHPNYEEIVRLAREKDDRLFDLISPEAKVAEMFANLPVRKELSDRVSLANGRLYFDRDEVHNSLSNHILRTLNEGGDALPWALFMERLDANPQQESKDMLYEFLAANEGGFTLTPEGLVVAYKGVQTIDGVFHSLNRGSAYVEDENGQMVQVSGTIPYRIGTTVEMPRSEVAFDPDQPCSTGLHVATWNFAQGYGRSGVILEVHVDPRDIVSVPKDASGEKVRVCRLFVKGVVEKKYESTVTEKPGWHEEEYIKPMAREAEDWLGSEDAKDWLGSEDDEPEDIDDENWLDSTPHRLATPVSEWKPDKHGGFFNWLKRR